MPVSFLSLTLLMAMGVGVLLVCVVPLAQEASGRRLILGASLLLLIPVPFILILAHAYDATLIFVFEIAGVLAGVGVLAVVFKWNGVNSLIDWAARGATLCVAAVLIWAGGTAFWGDVFLPADVVRGTVEQVGFSVGLSRRASVSKGFVVVDGQRFSATGDITKQLRVNDAVALYFGQGSGQILRVGVARHE